MLPFVVALKAVDLIVAAIKYVAGGEDELFLADLLACQAFYFSEHVGEYDEVSFFNVVFNFSRQLQFI